jgi:transcriptional regulator with XRE-family HTH domain
MSNTTRGRGRPKGRAYDKKSSGPLGDLIRLHRTRKGHGLLDVARACKCSVQFISNIEHGRAPLPWDKAEMLSKFLGIPFEELQAANLAIRSDFRSFLKTANPKRVSRASTPLPAADAASEGGETAPPIRDAASLISWTASLATRDSMLREILARYSSANGASRKRFYQAARKFLSES